MFVFWFCVEEREGNKSKNKNKYFVEFELRVIVIKI